MRDVFNCSPFTQYRPRITRDTLFIDSRKSNIRYECNQVISIMYHVVKLFEIFATVPQSHIYTQGKSILYARENVDFPWFMGHGDVYVLLSIRGLVYLLFCGVHGTIIEKKTKTQSERKAESIASICWCSRNVCTIAH